MRPIVTVFTALLRYIWGDMVLNAGWATVQININNPDVNPIRVTYLSNIENPAHCCDLNKTILHSKISDFFSTYRTLNEMHFQLLCAKLSPH